MNSQEFFDEIIEVDYGSDYAESCRDDTDKENDDQQTAKKIKVKKEQIAMMSTLLKGKNSMYLIIWLLHFIDNIRRWRFTR